MQRLNLSADPAELWTAVLRVAAETPRDEVIVSDLEPVEFDGTTLRLRACADEPSMRRALLTHGPQVAELVLRAVGVRVAVQIEAIDEPMAAVAQTDAAVLTEVMSHPLVREASTLFDARVVSVRPRSREDAAGLEDAVGGAPGEADT